MKKYVQPCVSVVCVLSVSLLTACETDNGTRSTKPIMPTTPNTMPTTATTQQFVAGSLLVGFKPQVDYRAAIADIAKQHKGVRLKRMLMESDTAVIALFDVPKGQEKTLIAAFSKHSAVEYAEVDGIVTIQ